MKQLIFPGLHTWESQISVTKCPLALLVNFTIGCQTITIVKCSLNCNPQEKTHSNPNITTDKKKYKS